MGIVSENIKLLRKQEGLTQEQMAERLKIKRSLLGAYEEGRADPRINNLVKFSEIFNVSIDKLINEKLDGQSSDKNKSVGNTDRKGLNILTITVDSNDKENIELVPQKAAAGYLNGYADPEFIGELPRFRLPMLSDQATYRAFEISGDSMLPLKDGTIIIGRYVEHLRDIVHGKSYILVTAREGVVYKRVFKRGGDLTLVSDNNIYDPYIIESGDILEIWEASAYISMDLPESDDEDKLTLNKIAKIVLDLQQEVIKLKKP